MFRLKTVVDKTILVLDKPNDTLDFVISIQNTINNMLSENNEKVIKKIQLNYGPKKETSEQLSKQYDGVVGFATLLKKSISAGNNGYFSGNRERWKYTFIEKNGEKVQFKNFDNHIKINFRCKSLEERETLKTLIMILLTFKQSQLDCSICDLDYISDVEIIKDELFEFNVYIYARTQVIFRTEDNQEPLNKVEYEAGVHNYNEEDQNEHDDDIEATDDFSNGF